MNGKTGIGEVCCDRQILQSALFSATTSIASGAAVTVKTEYRVNKGLGGRDLLGSSQLKVNPSENAESIVAFSMQEPWHRESLNSAAAAKHESTMAQKIQPGQMKLFVWSTQAVNLILAMNPVWLL